MARTGRELAVAHGPQFPAERLVGDPDPELLEQPLAKIDDSPAYNPVDRRRRSALDDGGKRRPVRVLEPGRLSRRLAVDEARRPERVELHHPVANDLQRHPADLGRLGPCGALIDRRQSQKPSSLRAVLGPPRGGPRLLRIKVSPKRYRHGEPPAFAMLNHCVADSKSSPESWSPGLGNKVKHALINKVRPLGHTATAITRPSGYGVRKG
jgi:hypothetical protein